jgi:hypothetical protein
MGNGVDNRQQKVTLGSDLRPGRGKPHVGLVDTSFSGESCPADPTVRRTLERGSMKHHTFTLILDGPTEIDPELERAVFEVGCDDAALGRRGGTVYLQFDREAGAFVHAVLSAIRDVHRIPGVRVARVEPDELVTASEIADRIGRTRESVRLMAEGARGPGGFPAPVSGASERRIRLWRWSDVADWLEAHGIAKGITEEARMIAAVNGALDLSGNADDSLREEILVALSVRP